MWKIHLQLHSSYDDVCVWEAVPFCRCCFVSQVSRVLGYSCCTSRSKKMWFCWIDWWYGINSCFSRFQLPTFVSPICHLSSLFPMSTLTYLQVFLCCLSPHQSAVLGHEQIRFHLTNCFGIVLGTNVWAKAVCCRKHDVSLQKYLWACHFG